MHFFEKRKLISGLPPIKRLFTIISLTLETKFSPNEIGNLLQKKSELDHTAHEAFQSFMSVVFPLRSQKSSSLHKWLKNTYVVHFVLNNFFQKALRNQCQVIITLALFSLHRLFFLPPSDLSYGIIMSPAMNYLTLLLSLKHN